MRDSELGGVLDAPGECGSFPLAAYVGTRRVTVSLPGYSSSRRLRAMTLLMTGWSSSASGMLMIRVKFGMEVEVGGWY